MRTTSRGTARAPVLATGSCPAADRHRARRRFQPAAHGTIPKIEPLATGLRALEHAPIRGGKARSQSRSPRSDTLALHAAAFAATLNASPPLCQRRSPVPTCPSPTKMAKWHPSKGRGFTASGVLNGIRTHYLRVNGSLLLPNELLAFSPTDVSMLSTEHVATTSFQGNNEPAVSIGRRLNIQQCTYRQYLLFTKGIQHRPKTQTASGHHPEAAENACSSDS